jgi:hypothetical protein
MFNVCIEHLAALLLMSGTLCTCSSVSALDLAKYSFLLVVTVHAEFDRDISDCVHIVCRGCSRTWYLMTFNSKQLMWWRELMLTPVLGSWYVLGLCEEKLQWMLVTSKSAFCLVTFTFLCVHILCWWKNFLFLTMVLSGYPSEETNLKVHENFVAL